MLLSCTDEAGNVFNFATHDNLFDVSTLGAGFYLLELRVGEDMWRGMVELD